MQPETRIRIAVAPAAAYEARRGLFDMLSGGLPVAFEPHIRGQFAGLQGFIALTEESEGEAAAEAGISSFEVHSADRVASSKQWAITFSSSELIHPAFRNCGLVDSSLENFSPVPEASECLARLDNQAVWTVEIKGSTQRHYVGVDLPSFADGAPFYRHFQGSRWFAMAPLLHFLGHLLGPRGWPVPEPRATFIIDDPNLHHRSYGYLDFAELANHAAVHNYHATVATVPLDAWYFDRDLATLFRTHKDRLSLMVHGVNHIADELARGYSEEAALELLAAGLRRISRFESRAGVTVDRVMAAPHGAFAESITDPMLRLGFEAACVSIGSLMYWNPGKPWPATLGLPFVQALGTEGFPVFHRTGPNETDVRLSAFLGHPIIIATHHQDCASNFALFERLANTINEIAPVRWTTIGDISRTNYVSRSENGVLRVKPFTRRLTVPISPEVDIVQIHSSPFARELTIELREMGSAVEESAGFCRYRVSNGVMQVFFPPRDPVDFSHVGPMRLGLWPITRRLLAETRDRVKPMLSAG